MLTYLADFDFGNYVFVDFLHLFELGVVKRQLEMTLQDMSSQNFLTLVNRIKKYEVRLDLSATYFMTISALVKDTLFYFQQTIAI
jgi:hypothetical protein